MQKETKGSTHPCHNLKQIWPWLEAEHMSYALPSAKEKNIFTNV